MILPNIFSPVFRQPSYWSLRYDSEYLTCSKKLTGSQLSLPHGTNKKLKCETKNKMMSVINLDDNRPHFQTLLRESSYKTSEEFFLDMMNTVLKNVICCSQDLKTSNSIV